MGQREDEADDHWTEFGDGPAYDPADYEAPVQPPPSRQKTMNEKNQGVEHELHEMARKLFAAEYPGRNFDDLDPGVRIGWLGSAHEEILAALSTNEVA